MNHLLRTVQRDVERYGILGLLSQAAGRLLGLVTNLRRTVRVEIRQQKRRAAEFDERYGVDTGGYVHQAVLNVGHPNEAHAVSYMGSDPLFFRRAIRSLSVDYPRFVFVDFGSGKGRAILLATEFPFKSIIGVEFSVGLHAIAQNNIRHFRVDNAERKNVRSVCMDAADFPIPDDCLVCYFYNPFDEAVMDRVVSNITESLLRTPRQCYIVYYNSRHDRLIDMCGHFRRVGAEGPVRIWCTTGT
jgi:SAM-dependent methyltransferase